MAGNDWKGIYTGVIERGRNRLEPPAPDQLVAYSRGELSEEEAERVREALGYYPDLALALSEQDDAAIHPPPALTAKDLAEDWERLQRKLSQPVPFAPRRSARPWQFATAASWLVIFALGAWILHLRNEIRQPHESIERVMLFEGGTRGPASANAVALQPSTRYIVFVLTTPGELRGDRFRVEMDNLDTNPPRLVWQSGISRSPDGTFLLEVPRSFLPSNAYALRLYTAGNLKPIATYSVWLAKTEG